MDRLTVRLGDRDDLAIYGVLYKTGDRWAVDVHYHLGRGTFTPGWGG